MELKFYRLSGATFYDCINTIYQFIKPFLDNKMSVFKEYGAFKGYRDTFMKDRGQAIVKCFLFVFLSL